MAIGGKFYLSSLSNPTKKFNYGSQMNKQAVKQGAETANAYATSLFSIYSSAGDEYVSLSFQTAVDRVQEQVNAKNAELQKAAESFNSITELFA